MKLTTIHAGDLTAGEHLLVDGKLVRVVRVDSSATLTIKPLGFWARVWWYICEAWRRAKVGATEATRTIGVYWRFYTCYHDPWMPQEALGRVRDKSYDFYDLMEGYVDVLRCSHCRRLHLRLTREVNKKFWELG